MIVAKEYLDREYLKFIINANKHLELAAESENGEDAFYTISSIEPDIILIDHDIQGINAYQTTKAIMRDYPIPIVLLAKKEQINQLDLEKKALEAGALSVIEKPQESNLVGYKDIAEELCNQLKIMSEIRVIKQSNENFTKNALDCELFNDFKKTSCNNKYRALGIVASTGGPTAILSVLKSLTRNFPIPIFVVQHMASSFMKGFADWLNNGCHFTVKIAQSSCLPEPGIVYVAPADFHMIIKSDIIKIIDTSPVVCQKPSGTVLFNSMASNYGPNSIGVLLTGMGSDGADGLKAMKVKGAFTITEDKSTSIVYGMPKVAEEIGASRTILPLDSISHKILSLIEN